VSKIRLAYMFCVVLLAEWKYLKLIVSCCFMLVLFIHVFTRVRRVGYQGVYVIK